MALLPGELIPGRLHSVQQSQSFVPVLLQSSHSVPEHTPRLASLYRNSEVTSCHMQKGQTHFCSIASSSSMTEAPLYCGQELKVPSQAHSSPSGRCAQFLIWPNSLGSTALSTLKDCQQNFERSVVIDHTQAFKLDSGNSALQHSLTATLMTIAASTAGVSAPKRYTRSMH